MARLQRLQASTTTALAVLMGAGLTAGAPPVTLAAGPAGLPTGDAPAPRFDIVEGAGPTATTRTIPSW